MVIHILIWAYSLLGIGGILAYAPQLYELVRDTSGSKHVPLTTWGLWGVQTAVNFIYAEVVLQNTPIVLVSGFSAIACNACLVALIYNRFYRKVLFNRRHSDA